LTAVDKCVKFGIDAESPKTDTNIFPWLKKQKSPKNQPREGSGCICDASVERPCPFGSKADPHGEV